MGSDVDDSPFVYDSNRIGVHNGRQSVGDDDCGSSSR